MNFDKADIARAAFAVVPITEGDWRQRLARNKRGVCLPNLSNAVIALSHAPEWKDVLAYDEFGLRVVTRKPAPWQKETGDWSDQDIRKLTIWLQDAEINVGVEVAGQAAQTVAYESHFHPVRDYLAELTHDGIPRVETWLSDYCGAEQGTYTNAIGERFLISAVARVLKPGSKVDTIPVLEGIQGLGKSTVGNILFAPWFCDYLPDLSSKDVFLQLGGMWGVEVAELDALSRAETSKIKQFLSAAIDRYRPPYGKLPIDVPRQVVFIGTCNLDVYLRDETGGRRFWPLKCGRIDLQALRRDRDQLWAEAVTLFNSGKPWWLDTAELVEQAAAQQSARLETDPWTEAIREWLQHPQTRVDGTGHPVAGFTSSADSITVADILAHCIGKACERQTQPDQNRVSRVLRALGWERFQQREQGVRVWRYRKS